MYKIIYRMFLIVFFVAYTLKPSCYAAPLVKKTFFEGAINGQPWQGDGVAFIEKNTIHIRGIFGPSLEYTYQIDIVVPKNNSITHKTNLKQASKSLTIGGDATYETYNSQGKPSDYITYFWNKNSGQIFGIFSFLGISDRKSNANSLIQGTFQVSANSSTNWDCNIISGSWHCGFSNQTKK